MHPVRQISLKETVKDLLPYKLEVKSVKKKVKEDRTAREDRIVMKEGLHKIPIPLELILIEMYPMDLEMQVMILEKHVNHFTNVILTLLEHRDKLHKTGVVLTHNQ